MVQHQTLPFPFDTKICQEQYASARPSQDEQAICNIIFIQKVIWETIIGSYLKQNNSDLVFQTRTIFLSE